MKNFVRMLALALLCAMLLGLAACGSGNTGGTTPPKLDPVEILPGYAYQDTDLSQYVSFGDWNYKDMTIHVTEVPEISDADVKKEFNSYFNNENAVYYQPIADTEKAIANGDLLYFYYSGVTMKALTDAVSAGKIPDVKCTGMTYSEILALNLGFSGGTSPSLSSLEIGSNKFIPGFESGLVGYVPSACGEENPVRLEISFPEDYGNAELAGTAVIFFCKLSYIGDKAAGAFTADTISVEYVNQILNLTSEDAYTSIDECLAQIRKGLEQKRTTELYNAKATAIFNALSEKANIPTVPDEMLSAYVNSVISSYLSDMVELYNEYPSYYASMFGEELPSEKLVAAYLGYKDADYMAKMKNDVTASVKNEMIFWYFVQTESITLTEAYKEERHAYYVELYGEAVFDDVADEVVEEQFLQDKFIGDLIEELEEKGNITYTPFEVTDK